MKNLSLLIVFNGPQWATRDDKVLQLRKWFSPSINLRTFVKQTNFATIPFEPYEGGPNLAGISRSWYDQNITPLAEGYNIVLFVCPLRQWQLDKNDARGWRTDKDAGPVELQIAADENSVLYVPVGANTPNKPSPAFFEYGRHELMHALFMLTGQLDTTHMWWDQWKLEGALAELVFPEVKQTEEERLLDILWLWIEAVQLWLKTPKGAPPPLPDDFDIPDIGGGVVQPSGNNFCLAIREHEGWGGPGAKIGGVVYPNGTRSFRNNNPGNIKYVGQALSIGADKDGFARFATYENGWLTLTRMIKNIAAGGSTTYRKTMQFYNPHGTTAEIWQRSSKSQRDTIESVGQMPGFFQIYAPASDNNVPERYARFVADRCGVSVSATIAQLVFE